MQNNIESNLSNLPKDPFMLLSVINMKLRDSERNLGELCRAEDIDRGALEKVLGDAGFTYLPEANQFR